MTKMSYGNGAQYGFVNQPVKNQTDKVPVFGGSTSGLISGAMGGGQQEYNPVAPLPRVHSDSPTQSGQSNLGTSAYNPASNPTGPRNMYTGQVIPYTQAELASNEAGLAAERERAAKWGNGGPTTPTNSGSGGPVFGGSTSGSTGSQSGGAQSQQSGAFQTWQVDPSQTVEGRAAGLISKDNPFMQQAVGAANQRANERGLINSSLAVQAAQDAVIGRATDIAKQDAATFADAGKFNVNQSNSWNLAQQELAQKGSQFDRDLQYRYDSARMNNENAIAMAALENKYQSQLQSDAAFNAQYRAYVDALLIIDQNENLDAEAKQALKFEQARILESYAAIRGLNLNLDFSSQYKWGAGSGSGSNQASGAAPAFGGAASGGGIVGGDGGNSGGGNAGAGANNGGQGFGVSNGSVTAGHVGLVGNAISALTGIPGLATVGNFTGVNRGIANSINAQNNLSAVAASAPPGTPNSALSAMIDGTPLAGETTPGTATSGPNGTGGAAAAAASAAASAAAAAGHSGAAQGAAAQAAADATLNGADSEAAAAAGAAAAVGADTDPSGADPGGFGGGFGGFGGDPGGVGPGGTDSNGMDGNSPW